MDAETSPERISLNDYVRERGMSPLRLHLGCGGQRLEGFVNVDLHPAEEGVVDSSREGCRADVYADMRHLDLDEATVAEIFTSHTFEHFTRWEALDMLAHWYRLLASDGRLVIETPDFVRCVLWLFHPRREKRTLALNMFYGNQWDRIDFETHRYVWSARELSRALEQVGFRTVKITHRTTTHYPGRDMRVVAVK